MYFLNEIRKYVIFHMLGNFFCNYFPTSSVMTSIFPKITPVVFAKSLHASICNFTLGRTANDAMPDSPCVMQPPQLFPQSSIMSTNMCSVVKNHAVSHIK